MFQDCHNKYNRLYGFDHRHVFSHNYGGQMSEIKMPAGLNKVDFGWGVW